MFIIHVSPHANGKRIVCKHIVALYFTVFPEEADRFLMEVEEELKQHEEYEKERMNKLHSYIYGMSKKEWAYEWFFHERLNI